MNYCLSLLELLGCTIFTLLQFIKPPEQIENETYRIEPQNNVKTKHIQKEGPAHFYYVENVEQNLE
jgi:hypothetical protein